MMIYLNFQYPNYLNMKELFKALGQFREQVSAVKKDADNPFYKSKYADLNSILEVIKDPLKQS